MIQPYPVLGYFYFQGGILKSQDWDEERATRTQKYHILMFSLDKLNVILPTNW